jgi:hypothetical protein
LINNNRITSFGNETRNYPRLIDLNVAFFNEIVTLFTLLFQAMWNQGFNSIVTGINAAAIQGQAADYARCYVHFFLCDLYSSIREVAMKESPTIFLGSYQAEMPRTGFNYDSFTQKLFNILHPMLCDKALEETLYYIDFHLDFDAEHDNYFGLDNVNANVITLNRMFAIVDTLNRSKSVSTGALQFGTKRGSCAALVDFYPRGDDDKEYGAIWLNEDNNYTDDALTLMYIVSRDLSISRMGPTFNSTKTPNEDTRNLMTRPFNSEFTLVEDSDAYGLNPYFVDGRGERVDTYEEARNQEAEYVHMYSRTWWFYRKKVLQTMTTTDRYTAFKLIVEG